MGSKLFESSRCIHSMLNMESIDAAFVGSHVAVFFQVASENGKPGLVPDSANLHDFACARGNVRSWWEWLRPFCAELVGRFDLIAEVGASSKHFSAWRCLASPDPRTERCDLLLLWFRRELRPWMLMTVWFDYYDWILCWNSADHQKKMRYLQSRHTCKYKAIDEFGKHPNKEANVENKDGQRPTVQNARRHFSIGER